MDHAAEAVDVGADVERLAADLLGRHVAVGALHLRLAAEQLAQAAGRLAGRLKSISLTTLSSRSRKLSGLMSRWIQPFSCRWARPAAAAGENLLRAMLKLLVAAGDDLLLEVGHLEQLQQHERAVGRVAEVVAS